MLSAPNVPSQYYVYGGENNITRIAFKKEVSKGKPIDLSGEHINIMQTILNVYSS